MAAGRILGEKLVAVMYVNFMSNYHANFVCTRGTDDRGISLKHVYTPEQMRTTLENSKMPWDVVFIPGYFPYGKEDIVNEALRLLRKNEPKMIVFTGHAYSDKREWEQIKDVMAGSKTLLARVPYNMSDPSKHERVK